MKEHSDRDEPLLTKSQKMVSRGQKYASHLLGAREYSRIQIERKLASKDYSDDVIAQICDELVANGWQSDERYCEVFMRSKVSRGQGLIRIRFELRQNGIDEQLLVSVLSRMDICWQQVCEATLQKKFGASLVVNGPRFRAKIERFLRHRGFSGEEVRAAIGRLGTTTGAIISEHDE